MFKKIASDTHDLIPFFILAFAFTWLLHAPRLMAAARWISLSSRVSTTLGHVAVFGPSLAAFLQTRVRFGCRGVHALWLRGWKVPFRRTWYLPALLLMPLAGLLTNAFLSLLGAAIPWEYSLSPAMIVPVGLMIWLLGALPEEYGWRGFALDRMQLHLNPLAASLVLGVIWSLWHLPLHFIPGTIQENIPVGEFTVQTIVLAVLYTWLHNHTSGSILIAGLFHAAGNLTGALLPTYFTTPGRWLGLLPLPVVAIVVVALGGLKSPTPFTPSGEAASPAGEIH